MTAEKTLTILVVSYDGYSDLWHDFFTCKQQNWPDCPYATVLANNTKTFDFKDVQVINCGADAQWSTRVQRALQEINSKYICLMVEDFFISERVDSNEIENALELMETKGIRYYKLHSLSDIVTEEYDGHPHLRTIPATLWYGVSLTTAIWQRDYLKEKLGSGNYNPWNFEVARNNEVQQAMATGDTTILGIYDNRNVLKICHMVVQGTFLPCAIKEMNQKGYTVDISKRTVMEQKDYFLYQLKGRISPLAQKYPWLKSLASKLGFKTVSEKNKVNNSRVSTNARVED